MRYDKDHKERTRRRLLTEASAAIRAGGPGQLAVAPLMAKLGLTHGGFYAHFKSKDDLVAQAVETSFELAGERFLESLQGRSAREGLIAYIDFYLSPEHVGAAGSGCPLPALAGDLARADAETRARFAAGVKRLSARIAALLEQTGVSPREAPDLARSALAEMVGAVSLARVTEDAADAEALVANSRRSVKARLGLS